MRASSYSFFRLLLLLLLQQRVWGAMHWSLLRILTDDLLEKTDRAKLVGNYKAPTMPTNDYLIDPSCDEDQDDETCQAAKANRRSVFPRKEDDDEGPLVCLAFLSCCGRTDLLQSTMQAVIHHMEHDEPEVLKRRYEIAWLDNGSPHEKQEHISSTFQVDHALPMPRNMGLAWGMNALMFDMCTAPYILLLEEDWLYMDGAVADHNIRRKHAIANALALLESKPVDPETKRPIKGVFLRTESNIVKTGRGVVPHATLGSDDNSDDEYTVDNLEYRISCMKFPDNGHIFGAFTNGAGLYERDALIHQVGRMYGEPGDVFSDLAVEGNYCFRVGLQFCASRINMDPTIPECDFDNNPHVPPTCAAVFAHIGGGRGTRPARRIHMKCPDDAWNFYGTPWFDQIPKEECSKHIGTIWKQLLLNEEFQRINDENNEAVFAREQEQRKKMLSLADLFEPKSSDPEEFRRYYGAHDAQYASMTDDEIRSFPTKLRKMALSEHQLPGFWDILGRPLGVEFETPYSDDL
ncbi:expressed unknown protein [Seminavis robusta]|uniref:Glycosyltransferase 2-like domain-containing protein n=1 Tax=Seminavis robusta TaxID=568900 RepID=A0A9N8HS11_9STRA|nr:expressed unknown protein [Seminavis robusta]|eukprot:Sro1333_g263710.1 n/a (520) ;mRNA; f:22476-24143